MKTVGVMSDSHGDKEKISRAFELMNSCDVIVHLGDHAQDALGYGKEIIAVSGNCDWFSKEPLSRILELEGVKIYLTHGHRENVKMGLMRLFYRAQEENVSLALYGHTHIARKEEADGITLVNPGALKDGRYAVIEVEKGGFGVKFMNLPSDTVSR